MSDKDQSRVDPKTIQQWRDRQLPKTSKPPTKAEKLAAETRLADLLNQPQRLTGLLSRPAASGGKVMVVLHKPYRGLTSIPAIAIDGCDSLGKVTLLRDKDGNWYAIGKGRETTRKDRDIERSSEPSESLVRGDIAYCYAVFIKRRVNTSAVYKWFWQVFVGGWQAENILVKEWEVPASTTGSSIPRYLPSPIAIVDFRGGTFYVSLQYVVWASNANQQRYALFKGTKEEDLETEWDKSTIEMRPQSLGVLLNLSPHGFGYWSKQGGNIAILYAGEITVYPNTEEISGGSSTSSVKETTFAPQGWRKAVKSFVMYSRVATGGANSYYDETVKEKKIRLYRLSEDGENLLSASFERDFTSSGFTSGLSGSATSSDVKRCQLQSQTVYSYDGAVSSTESTYNAVETIKLNMPEGGGNIPFMAKLANTGNAFTTSPPKPAIATGSVIPDIVVLSIGTVLGAGSPYLTDVHSKFISAIACPDLLNRGTTETQNIYGDLSPIYPLVGSASDLSALTGIRDGAVYGVTSLGFHFKFSLVSTATPNGTTVLNAAGGYGRWIYGGVLPTNPATPSETKLPGVMSMFDIFPEMQEAPPAPEWIGYKNIEHENRTVKVYLWQPDFAGLFEDKPVEVEVQKIDAVKKIIDDDTLQELLSYTLFNASFG